MVNEPLLPGAFTSYSILKMFVKWEIWKKNPPRKPDAPLNSQLICTNCISMFSFCMATFPSNPWADSFSVANDLFSLAVIHHRIRWLLNQSSIRKSSTFSLFLSQGRWCSSQDVQIYVSDACIAWFPVLSVSPAPVLHHPPTPQQPWLSSPSASWVLECQQDINWRMGPDLSKSGHLQHCGLVINQGIQPKLH